MLLGLDTGPLEMAKFYEGDYEYELATDLAHDIPRLRENLKTKEYLPAVRVFADSVQRIRDLHWLPVELLYVMQAVTVARASALHRTGSDPMALLDKMTDAQEALASSIFTDMLKKIQEAPGGVFQHTWRVGNSHLKSLLQAEIEGKEPPYKIVAVEAVLAAIITASYGALETLAEDIWIAALNRHPLLAKNFMEANKDKKLDMLATFGDGLDLTHRMGSMLVKTRKVQFQTFYDFKNAYEQSVPKEIADPLFSDCSGVLLAEKVRHLIAHRGGIVDAKFKQEMGDFSGSGYDEIKVGEQLRFDGPIVALHLESCLDMGRAIILAVDEWSCTAPTN